MTGHAWPARLPRKAGAAVLAVGALVLLLLYMQGTIGGRKVGPGTLPLAAGATPTGSVAVVEQRPVQDLVAWPGTIASRSVASVAPKVMAHVLDVRVGIGSQVKAGDVLVSLDDRDIRARAQQARAALAAAQAHAGQTDADLRRIRTLFRKQAATPQDMDAADARAKAAQAQVAQARDALAEARVRLGETTVRAPFDGVVAERLVDPGDMAMPGKPLLVVHNPRALRLNALVAEHCSGGLQVGAPVQVHFDAPARDVDARIDEIAPMADPQTRTVLVKVGLPPRPDLYPGGFGALRTACGTHQALLIPAAAVVRAGQLETVRVAVDGRRELRDVRTGQRYGDDVEVLSGLRRGERVGVEPAATPGAP